jgi:hypothetical protein
MVESGRAGGVSSIVETFGAIYRAPAVVKVEEK